MELTSSGRPALSECAEFATSIALSVFVFVILILPVVGLEVLADFLSHRELVSGVVIYVLTAVKYMFLALDSVLCILSVVAQAVRTLRRLQKADAQPRYRAAVLGIAAATLLVLSVALHAVPEILNRMP